jgi:hypothetical protein
MTLKEMGPDIPSPQDLTAFAKEYYKSYMDIVDEKKPPVLPKFAHEGPYRIQCYLLPNGCIVMIFTTGPELKVESGTKDWEAVQEIVVKGVDHFAGFYPFECRSLGDWNKRGKRDAVRDMRLLEKSDLARNSVELESVLENLTTMFKVNFWLNQPGTPGSEMLSTLRGMQSRARAGFPTVDAIATLQSLKAYTPGAESVKIDFPDKQLLENINEGIKGLSGMESKIGAVENRLLAIEKSAQSPEMSSTMKDAAARIDRLEQQLEKVSNILTMLNSKVETYFSKAAEKERQAELEARIDEHNSKATTHDSKITDLEKEAETLVQEMRKMAGKMDKELQESRKRIARIEKHFVEFAKTVQE